MKNNQFELYNHALKRIKQKKRLYFHFVLFLIGSVFMIIINKFLNVKPEYNWFVWVIIGWSFLLILHFIKVFITDNFMDKNWEKKHIERLVIIQEKKLKKLEKKVEDNFSKNTDTNIE